VCGYTHYIGHLNKITFGKTYRNANKLLMPVSVNAHHGLVDGKHIGTYFEIFQELLNE